MTLPTVSANIPPELDTAAFGVFYNALEKYNTSFKTKLTIVYDRCQTAWETFHYFAPGATQDGEDAKRLRKDCKVLFTKAHTEACHDAVVVVKLGKVGNLEPEIESMLEVSMNDKFKEYMLLQDYKAYQRARERLLINFPIG